MQTLTPSNYEQLQRTFEAEGIKEYFKEVPREIRHDERKMYHVIAIKIEKQEGKIRNKVVVFPIQKHPKDYEKLVSQSNFKNHGIDMLYLLHDPTTLEDFLQVDQTEREKSIEQIKAEAKQEANNEILRALGAHNKEMSEAMKMIAIALGQKGPGGSVPTKDEDNPPPLATATRVAPEGKDAKTAIIPEGNQQGPTPIEEEVEEVLNLHPNQIRVFAREKGIDLGEARTKGEMAEKLKAWLNNSN